MSIKFFGIRRAAILTVVVCMLLPMVTGCQQTIEEQQPEQITDEKSIVADWKAGWNLGNSLDVIDYNRTDAPEYYETLWGNPLTTKGVFQAVKDAGFDVVRIPVTWYDHTDAEGNISEDWMEHVQEVVDLALDTGLYCIINLHHDTGKTAWIKADPSRETEITTIAENLWWQIAYHFRNYDEHLLFEGFNEILNNSNSWDQATKQELNMVNNLNQAFVDTVRASGDQNANRTLIVPTYASSSRRDSIGSFVLPTDSAENKLVVSVHFYTTDVLYIEDMFERIQLKFLERDIPVIVDECGMKKDGDNDEERIQYALSTFAEGRKRGICCFWWDSGGIFKDKSEVKDFALLDRQKYTWYNEDLVHAIVYGKIGKE